MQDQQLTEQIIGCAMKVGLLLNFGAERLEFKRKTRTYRPKKNRQDVQDFRL